MKCLNEVVVDAVAQFPNLNEWDPYFVQQLVNSRSIERGNRTRWSKDFGSIYAWDVNTQKSCTTWTLNTIIMATQHPLTWSVRQLIVIAVDFSSKRRM